MVAAEQRNSIVRVLTPPAWMAGAREPRVGTRREVVSAPLMEARGTLELKLERETVAWMEGRHAELAGKEVVTLRVR